jgi:hypothetical protein
MEALTDCLGQVRPGDHGMVLLWDGWSPLARHDEDTFRKAVEAFRRRAEVPDQPGFSVVLRGQGPDLDLEELPVKH